MSQPADPAQVPHGRGIDLQNRNLYPCLKCRRLIRKSQGRPFSLMRRNILLGSGRICNLCIKGE